jgi:hypothetical protein
MDLEHEDVVLVSIYIQVAAREFIFEHLLNHEVTLVNLCNNEVVGSDVLIVEIRSLKSDLLLDMHHHVTHLDMCLTLVDLFTHFVG